MDYYEILNIEKNASFAEIKKSYQQLILKYHPDKVSKDKCCIEDQFIILIFLES